MVVPSDQFALVIESALQKVKATGAILVMLQVIFARPRQFDGFLDLLGNGGCFNNIIWNQASTKTAAATGNVQGNFIFGYAQCFRNNFLTGFRILRGSPNFNRAVFIPSRAILRFYTGM